MLSSSWNISVISIGSDSLPSSTIGHLDSASTLAPRLSTKPFLSSTVTAISSGQPSFVTSGPSSNSTHFGSYTYGPPAPSSSPSQHPQGIIIVSSMLGSTASRPRITHAPNTSNTFTGVANVSIEKSEDSISIASHSSASPISTPAQNISQLDLGVTTTDAEFWPTTSETQVFPSNDVSKGMTDTVQTNGAGGTVSQAKISSIAAPLDPLDESYGLYY